jgi:hypothetical protein
MGSWVVDPQRKPGILWLELDGEFSPDEMLAFVAAHNAGVDGFGGEQYQVFCDIRALKVLSPECAEILERAKAYSGNRRNFRGSAVWTSGAVVALQHRRTSASGGVMKTELMSDDDAVLWRHLSSLAS